MGRKGPSWLARACGGGHQAETAKRSIDLASLQGERLSTINSLYEEASHGGKLDTIAAQMADMSLDDQKALAQDSYISAASIEGANEWVESEIKSADEQVAVRCYLKADSSLSAEPKSRSQVPLSKEMAVKANSTLVDEGSLAYNTIYDDDETQSESHKLAEEGLWEPLTDVIDCVKDWQQQVREMKSRTQEIEASCMRGKCAENFSPTAMRISSLEARCRHMEDENFKLRVQVNEYEKQCGLLIHRNSKYAKFKKDMSTEVKKSEERSATLEQAAKQLLSRAEYAEARVAELWKKIHDLEDSISKGIELLTLQKQLKDAKKQLAVFEADIQSHLSSATTKHDALPVPEIEQKVHISDRPEWYQEGLIYNSEHQQEATDDLRRPQQRLKNGSMQTEHQPFSPLEGMASPRGYDSSISMRRSSEDVAGPPRALPMQTAQASPEMLAAQQLELKLNAGGGAMGGGKATQSPPPHMNTPSSPYVPLQAQWTPQLSSQILNHYPHPPSHGDRRVSPQGSTWQEGYTPARGKGALGNGVPAATKKRNGGGGRVRNAAQPKGAVSSHAARKASSSKLAGTAGLRSPRGAMAAQVLTGRSSARRRMESSKSTAFR